VDARDMRAPKGGIDYCGLLTPAEIGCAISHLLVIGEIASGKDDYGIVLEDDIFLLPEARKFLTKNSCVPYQHSTSFNLRALTRNKNRVSNSTST
jgi:GR25 family glycosyltransferase involved in LPS biosynthesis